MKGLKALPITMLVVGVIMALGILSSTAEASQIWITNNTGYTIRYMQIQLNDGSWSDKFEASLKQGGSFPFDAPDWINRLTIAAYSNATNFKIFNFGINSSSSQVVVMN